MRKVLKKVLWDCHNAVKTIVGTYEPGNQYVTPEDIEILNQVAWILRRRAEGFGYTKAIRSIDKKLCRLMDERAEKIRAELYSLKGQVKKVNGEWKEADGRRMGR